jgi:hypothetical protein
MGFAMSLAALCWGQARAAEGLDTGLLWPLPIEINLASSFGEYRQRHLHAGLDIRTFGREGIPCLAVADGYVSRLRASPYGYGKAIYLKLLSGKTAVYAHLSEFMPGLEEVLYEKQQGERRYRIDTHFPPNRIPVRRGEVIGYSGGTGAGAPHLHFEVRDEAENPINPLSIGWTVDDHVSPRIQAAVWLPLSKMTRIEGMYAPRKVRFRQVSPGSFVSRDTVSITGTVGLGAEIIDRLNGSSGRLAPYRVELSVNGVVLASIEMERFSYAHTREVELTYYMRSIRRGEGHYMLLFRRRGETLWNRTFQRDGMVDSDALSKSSARRVHTALIRAIDRAGNVSVASIPFRTGHRSDGGDPTTSGRKVPDVAGSSAIPGCYIFDDVLGMPPSAVLRGARPGAGEGVLMRTVRAQGYTASVEDFHGEAAVMELRSEGSVVEAHVLPIGGRSSVFYDAFGLDASVSVPKGALYGDAFVVLMPWEKKAASKATTRELVPSRTPILVGPLSLAVREGVELRFGLGRAAGDREAIYVLNEKKDEWEFITSILRNDTVSAVVRSPGVYGVFSDVTPPRIGSPHVRRHNSYAGTEAIAQIIIPIEDEGSGLDDERTEVFLAGKKRVARWDGFSQKMFVLVREQNIMGMQLLSVVAVDRCGNTTTLEKEIKISPKLFDTDAGLKDRAR